MTSVSAYLMPLARVACMAVNLIGIPILLSRLGSVGFGAWALLTGAGYLFFSLEMTMPMAMVKFLSLIKDSNSDGKNRIYTHALAIMGAFYGLGFVILGGLSEKLAVWMKIPNTDWIPASNLVIWVFVCVILVSGFKLSLYSLYGQGRFEILAAVEFFQVCLASLLSWIAACFTRRFDITVMVYWSVQVLWIVAVRARLRRLLELRFNPVSFRLTGLMDLLKHGGNLQISNFAFFSQFQFNKMIVAAYAGVSEVAHYEVAGRGILALRNLPEAGFKTFLPAVSRQAGGGHESWLFFCKLSKLASLASALFIIGPMIVSPMLLFAWAGQLGFHGRWVFLFLGAGMSLSVAVMPVSIFIQAMGKTWLETRLAVATFVLNLMLSFLFVRFWGKEGVAAGAGISLLIYHLVYFYLFHRLNGQNITATGLDLLQFIFPVVVICTIWIFIVIQVMPLVISSRWYMVPASLLLYAGFLTSVICWYWFSGELVKLHAGLTDQSLRG